VQTYNTFDRMKDVVGNPRSVNPCSRTVFKFVAGTGTSVFTNSLTKTVLTVSGPTTSYQLVQSRPLGGKPTPITFDTDALLARAKLGALAKVDRTPYAFGEDLAELHKTLGLVKNIAGPLDDINKDFEKSIRKYSKSLSYMRALSKAWLIYRFVYGNLARTSESALKAFSERNLDRPLQRRSVFSEPISISRASSFTRGWEASRFDTFTLNETLTGFVKAGVYYQQTNPLRDWRYELGLRNKDIIQTMWQLVPASWVVDRFINISNNIKAIHNFLDPSITITDGWVTVDVSRTEQVRFTAQTNPGWTSTVSGSSDITFLRSVFRSPWVPSFADAAVPVVNIDTSITSVLDVSAFFIQRCFRVR
jgi:hypothetical protein